MSEAVNKHMGLGVGEVLWFSYPTATIGIRILSSLCSSYISPQREYNLKNGISTR